MLNLEHLFSYGTLQDTKVQLATFGRTLSGQPDVLERYREGRVPIRMGLLTIPTDEYHLNAEFTGRDSDSINGTVFEVTTDELDQADSYEATANYKRSRVELRSGKQAWVYVADATLRDRS
jgi:gamma-glutamylcyclotransferase (GGCT)/AIG2-like uncharacterized protein YtfP